MLEGGYVNRAEHGTNITLMCDGAIAYVLKKCGFRSPAEVNDAYLFLEEHAPVRPPKPRKHKLHKDRWHAENYVYPRHPYR